MSDGGASKATLGRLDDASARVLATRCAAEQYGRSRRIDRGRRTSGSRRCCPAPTAAREEVDEAMRVDGGGRRAGGGGDDERERVDTEA